MCEKKKQEDKDITNMNKIYTKKQKDSIRMTASTIIAPKKYYVQSSRYRTSKHADV